MAEEVVLQGIVAFFSTRFVSCAEICSSNIVSSNTIPAFCIKSDILNGIVRRGGDFSQVGICPGCGRGTEMAAL